MQMSEILRMRVIVLYNAYIHAEPIHLVIPRLSTDCE
jgi:hypothetical protein